VSLRLASLTGAGLRAVVLRDPVRRAAHRARVRRLSRALLTAPTVVRRDSPATTPERDLVVCSLEAWDDVWRRNQFLVRELQARDPSARILFVEPPFDWVLWLRHRQGHRRRGLRPVGDTQLVRFQPGKVWPRLAGPWADRSLRRQVQRAARARGLQHPTLWVNDPSYAGLLSQTGWPALYDMTDDWLHAAATPRALRRLQADEAVLFAEAGAVTVCSPELADSRRSVRPDLELIPNAVDQGHFGRARPRPIDLPAGPVAVYVGTLHEDRLDVDLVVALAAALAPSSTAEAGRAVVVLVGPDALTPASRARLHDAGVVLLGPRPYADVPAYLQHATVVVVPHVVTPFTESLDPIKAYECLAVGRPTVATPIAGFRDLGPPVVTVEADGFVDEVRRLLTTPEPDTPRAVPSWTERAAAFAEAARRAREGRPTPAIRVVFVDHCAQLSGGELALARLIPALEGVESHVILGEPGPLEDMLRRRGATVEVLALDAGVRDTKRDQVQRGVGPARVAAAAGDVLALRRRLRQIRPDLVHTNSLKAALYGGLAGVLARVPVVWHIRDRIAADYLPRPAVVIVRVLSRLLPSAVIVNSRATLETLGPADPLRAASLVWDAAEPDRGGEPDQAGEPDRPSPPDAPFRVAMVGRLAPWKGQHLFVEAFAKAFPDGPETAVVAGTAMFGEDDYADEVQRLIDQLGLTERVELVGFVDDVPALLRSVDAVVHASVIAEPFGQVVIEGMAAGRPVIASAAGGPLEVVTDGVDGLLFPPGDVEALARHLVRLATDPAFAAELGHHACVRAQDFTPARTAAGVEAVYERVLRRPVPPT
jgi:teichuronic acid biosynthesis glycosyltransferase TuaH